MANKKIGFIGLGIMGSPMAGHLMKAGHSLVVYDIVPAAADGLVQQGATRGASPQEVAGQVEVVISMVPDSPDVERVYLGEDGVLAGAKQGTLLIDMSSISPVTAIQVAKAADEQGCPMLDAPVSGGQVGAQSATLSIMVGGSDADVQRARPILETVGKRVTHLGPAGSGQDQPCPAHHGAARRRLSSPRHVCRVHACR